MERITLLDGASGTRLWALAEAAGVPKAPTWSYNLSHPELVTQIGREYVEAGSEILYANTFAANRLSVKDGEASVAAAVRAGVEAAKAAAGDAARVAMDVGPLTAMLEPYGDLGEAEAEEIFAEQIGAGMDAGAELIVLETFMDLNLLKCAVHAAKKYDAPLLCSMTFNANGRTLAGDRVEEVVAALEALGADAVGMNCSPEPETGILQRRQTGIRLL